LIDLDFNIWYI